MMLKRTSTIKSVIFKSFTLFWAIAILWFYLGNLVNFHQNRIWGKILIPSCYTHSSVNTKNFSTHHVTGDDLMSSKFIDSFDAVQEITSSSINLFTVETCTLICNPVEAIKPAPQAGDQRLRAPPLS